MRWLNKDNNSQNRIWIAVIPIVVFGLLGLPRLTDLTDHWSSDETTWLFRSHGFATSLQRHDYGGTYQSYHPGVITMWLGGLALWREYGDGLAVAPSLVVRKFLSPAQLSNARLPVAILTYLTILVMGLLLRRLLGSPVAYVSVLFLALNPFFLAESRRLHTDALAAGFLMISFLCWLCYLEAEIPRRREIVFSGISFGLACLSKSLAGGFLLFLPFLLFAYSKHSPKATSRLLWSVFLWVATAVLTVILLWPYLWTLHLGSIPLSPLLIIAAFGMAIVAAQRGSINTAPDTDNGPSGVDGKSASRIQAVLGKVIIACGLLGIIAILLGASRFILTRVYWALTTPHEVPQLFLGHVSNAQGGLYYPVHALVWSAPLTIPLVTYAIWQIVSRHGLTPSISRICLVLFLFGCFYVCGLTLVAKKLARYLVITAPVWDVLAAIGAVALMRLVRETLKKPILAYAVLILVLSLQALPVLMLHPNYRAYHHPAIPAGWIANNISQGGGIGLDRAAEYLNNKPNAEQLTVYMTPLAGFLEYYFKGQTRILDPHITPYKSDYVVVYIRDKQIGWTLPTQLSQALALEHIVSVNGVDYAWIYKMDTTIADG